MLLAVSPVFSYHSIAEEPEVPVARNVRDTLEEPEIPSPPVGIAPKLTLAPGKEKPPDDAKVKLPPGD